MIAGEGGFFTTPNGQRGAMLRAYDKATGQEVGAVYMPAPQTGSPMTYMLNGKQYLVVAISGPGILGRADRIQTPEVFALSAGRTFVRPVSPSPPHSSYDNRGHRVGLRANPVESSRRC